MSETVAIWELELPAFRMRVKAGDDAGVVARVD